MDNLSHKLKAAEEYYKLFMSAEGTDPGRAYPEDNAKDGGVTSKSDISAVKIKCVIDTKYQKPSICKCAEKCSCEDDHSSESSKGDRSWFTSFKNLFKWMFGTIVAMIKYCVAFLAMLLLMTEILVLRACKLSQDYIVAPMIIWTQGTFSWPLTFRWLGLPWLQTFTFEFSTEG